MLQNSSAVQDMIQNMLLFYKLDQVMGKFVPGLKGDLPGPLKHHVEEEFTWGPGGSRQSVLGKWAELHANFLGRQHLEALQKVSGSFILLSCSHTSHAGLQVKNTNYGEYNRLLVILCSCQSTSLLSTDSTRTCSVFFTVSFRLSFFSKPVSKDNTMLRLCIFLCAHKFVQSSWNNFHGALIELVNVFLKLCQF